MKPSLQLVHFLQISIVTPSSPFEWGEEVGQLGSGVTMTGKHSILGTAHNRGNMFHFLTSKLKVQK